MKTASWFRLVVLLVSILATIVGGYAWQTGLSRNLLLGLGLIASIVALLVNAFTKSSKKNQIDPSDSLMLNRMTGLNTFDSSDLGGGGDVGDSGGDGGGD
jgi:hypothetical protein